MSRIGGKKYLIFMGIIALVVILLITYFVYKMNTQKYGPIAANPVVMAHRGYFVSAVENTMGSLEAAAVFKPDYVELDVVGILKNKNVNTKYLIQSLDWDTVLKVNELAPEIVAG